MPAWSSCPTCSAVVVDLPAHQEWHQATGTVPAPPPEEEAPDADD